MTVPTSDEPLSKMQAVDLIRAHSSPYSDADPRPCIHTRLGGIGADWMTDQLVDYIEQADTDVQWAYGLLRHDLVVIRPAAGDLFVAVHAPERGGDCDRCDPAGVTV